MRKLSIIICALLAGVSVASAQSESRSVAATDVEMTRSGEDVTIGFILGAGKKATKATYNLVIEPVLSNGENEKALTPIVIQGRRSKVIDARHEIGAGRLAQEQTSQVMMPGSSMEYSATVKYEEWMRGSQLIFNGSSVGCCSATEVELGLLADNILYAKPVFETKIEQVRTIVPHSTGDMLAQQYPFVVPVEEYDSIMQGDRSEIASRLLADTRQGSISVYFGQSLKEIDKNFGDNNENLVALISAVRALVAAEDSKIEAIVIAGFASPEGGVALNERLSQDRAEAVRKFLTDHSEVDPNLVSIYNGGADWAGLRELVEKSDLVQKQRIIEIIDTVPVWDSARNIGRLGELQRMDGGEPYRQMLADIFPELRQAAYIKVYYNNTNFSNKTF